MMDGLDEKAFGGAWITWSANFLAEKEKLRKISLWLDQVARSIA
jgi:hypothetical protein